MSDYDVSRDLQSPWVGPDDVRAGTLSFRIAAVTMRHFAARQTMPACDAYVLVFEGEPERHLTVRKGSVNLRVLAEAFGPLTGAWVGRDVDVQLARLKGAGTEYVAVVIPPAGEDDADPPAEPGDLYEGVPWGPEGQ